MAGRLYQFVKPSGAGHVCGQWVVIKYQFRDVDHTAAKNGRDDATNAATSAANSTRSASCNAAHANSTGHGTTRADGKWANCIQSPVWEYPDFVPRTLNADEVNAALEQYNKEKEQKDLPSLTLSLLPIVVPIVLIFLKAICSTLATVEGWSGLATHPVVQAINFVGSPVIALAISVLLAVYTLVPRMDKHTTAERLEEGLQSAGIILLVTGAGGALGAILRDSGAGQQLAEQVANLPISPILIPFIVATLVRLIQGSGTVAMITAASISAPILAQIPGINMLLAAQAATMGSLFFGYFNDSLFWVVNRMMGVSDVKQQMVVWSVPTTIAWAIGGTGVALINLLFGSGGSWLDPLLPIVVLAAIMLWVRWQAQGIKDKLVVKD